MKVKILSFFQICSLITVAICYVDEIQYQKLNASQCQSIITDQFIQQGIDFKCSSGQIVVSNQNEITLDLDLVGKKITTPIMFKDIAKLNFNKVQITNFKLEKSFISVKGVQEFNINSIMIDIANQEGLSLEWILKAYQIKQINIDQINVGHTPQYLIQLSANSIKINNLQTLSINNLELSSNNLIQINYFLIREVQTQSYTLTLKLLTNTNIEIGQLIVQSSSSNQNQRYLNNNNQIEYQIFNSQTFFQISITEIEQVNIGSILVKGYTTLPLLYQDESLIMLNKVSNFTTSNIQIKENSFISQSIIQGTVLDFAVIDQIDIKPGQKSVFNSYLLYIPQSNQVSIKGLSLDGIQFQQESLFYYDASYMDLNQQKIQQQQFIIKVQQLKSSLKFNDLFADMKQSKQSQNLSLLFLNLGLPSEQYPFYTLETQNSYIKNGQSQDFGGCFQLHNLKQSSIQQIKLIFKNTTFDSCVSKYLGGAISGGFLTEANDLNIINCKSKIGGGLYIYQSESNKTELQKINFQNNKAYLTGNDYSFEIEEILIHKIEELNLDLKNPYAIIKTDQFLYQGLTYVVSLSFKINNQIFSDFNKDSSFENMYSFILNTNDNYLLDSPQLLSSYNSPYFIWVLEHADFQGNQLTNINLKQIQFNNIQYSLNTSNYQVFNGCKQQGMEKVKVQYGGKQTFICRYCQQSKANYDQAQCQSCSFNQFQECFANYSLLQESYWRLNYTIDSDQIYKCSLNPSSCVSGSGVGNSLCYQGHIGAQCLNCDIDGVYWGENNYYNVNFQKTQK
ncbi:hypothetical protein TTHERM_000304271 (macronuclear) [Tetrahymena thermophila SB210]|uniref:Transmembrane protein n=1 Tax=Tetrahymena thermophila (strain SB210) TaxID=312017 RepID=W7XG90_TETTS|nr:hypothetical protein TTHERM_000304271 [Tetrahymena thermophila SB210]EWS73116.1 hypothetical protein TTHERM_000304271 [Tetrahymena thermophila SB210]|eukprot:XP_012654303.1 hypothetical protein TTHERM_000304271 [Tetrahymena thermophila SB210]